MNNKLNHHKIYNDVVDEAYELEEGEDVIEERQIKNQLIDGEVVVSDDSQNYVQTPPNEEDMENDYQNEQGD